MGRNRAGQGKIKTEHRVQQAKENPSREEEEKKLRSVKKKVMERKEKKSGALNEQ